MVELTPERAIEVQILLGSDIPMQLDECVRLPAERSEIERAMQLSLRWAERCKRAFESAASRAARCSASCRAATIRICARRARARSPLSAFDGYAIGGLAVGEPQEVMLEIVGETAPVLPADRPRYLMGVGTPADILAPIARGIDMFDCVLPTRNGRHGLAFTRFGPINIRTPATPRIRGRSMPRAAARRRAIFARLSASPVPSGEALGGMLLSIVNLYYYQDLVAGARAAIAAGRFADYAAQTKEQWAAKRDTGSRRHARTDVMPQRRACDGRRMTLHVAPQNRLQQDLGI